jgi:uncharacterized protein with FMN-binding domain
MFPRRGAIAIITTFLALILLFNFEATEQGAVGVITQTGGSTVTASPNSGTSPSGGAAVTSPAATAPAGTAQTVNGPVISTRYGDVAVQVTVADGTITAVEAAQLPSGGRSGQISRSVAPILASEALAAQSANIDIVSGATYTSEAYAESLQAALDQAGIASANTGVTG